MSKKLLKLFNLKKLKKNCTNEIKIKNGLKAGKTGRHNSKMTNVSGFTESSSAHILLIEKARSVFK